MFCSTIVVQLYCSTDMYSQAVVHHDGSVLMISIGIFGDSPPLTDLRIYGYGILLAF